MINTFVPRLLSSERMAADPKSLRFETSSPFESDRARIALCAPFRRLQQKTQVFPLDVKTSSRSRLTHSLEVEHYARTLMLRLCRDNPVLSEHLPQLLALCENASRLHDIGNPPFGHFGERLIESFAKEQAGLGSLNLNPDEKADLCVFNGNAQGLRVVHTIQKLNLTLAQLSAMLKHPYTFDEQSPCGVFLSERPVLQKIRERCCAATHPAAVIMDLCDDLAYALADFEDGFDNNILGPSDLDRFFSEYEAACGSADPQLADEQLPFAAENKRSPAEAFQEARAKVTLGYLKEACTVLSADEFIKEGLTEELQSKLASLPHFKFIRTLKEFEHRRIYQSAKIESLELSGASCLKYLFKTYAQVLQLSPQEFCASLEGKGGDPYLLRLCRRISRRHKEAYLEHAGLKDFSEGYLRLRLIIDYISGMTDTYAAAEFTLLSGLSAARRDGW